VPAERPPGYFAGLSRDTFLLACASLFSDISTEMLYPVLPVFLTQVLGAGGSAVGLIDGCAQASQNLMQGVSGALSDRLRRRKPLALCGYLLSALAKPLIGLAGSWPGVLTARFLDRLAAGTRAAPRDALIAGSVQPAYRGRAFGLEGVGDNAGACLGPLLALALLGAAGIGLRSIFYIAVIPGLLAFGMVLLVREQRATATAEQNPKAGLRGLPRAYWRYLLVTAIFGLGNSSNAFLILRMQDDGASLSATILVYAAYNLVAALISYPAGALSDRWGRRSLLGVAFAVFLLAYAGFGMTRSVGTAAALFALYGLYQGVFRAVGKSLAADLSPAAMRATGIGCYSAAVGLLQLVASVVAGILWDRVGHAAVFWYGALFAFFGGIALVLLMPAAARTVPDPAC
jgi:MFS family permease